MTADRKAALMEYAMAVQAELDAFTEAMFGPPGDMKADDAWSAADLLLRRAEIATRVYISSGAMLTITRWQRTKTDQIEAQRAALKAEVPPSGASPIEGGVILEPPRMTAEERRQHADRDDEVFMASWTKLVDDADAKKLDRSVFDALIADGVVKKAAPGEALVTKLKAIYSEKVKASLIAKAKEAGWRP